MKKVAVLVGSLRKDSNSIKIGKSLEHITQGQFEFVFPNIGELPFFNQDIEANPPSSWEKFRKEIKAVDAVLIITPEYNRSMPAVIKNALDVGSRPYGESVFNNKPAAVISSSIGALGGFGANHHIRQVLSFLNMPTLQQPEMYVGKAQDFFDESGKIKDASFTKYLETFLQAFSKWVELITHK